MSCWTISAVFSYLSTILCCINVNFVSLERNFDLWNLLKFVKFFHAVMSYGIPFWGNSYHNIKNFWMQKRVIRIIMDCGNRDSCRILFNKLKILPLISQCILSLLIFVVNNRDQFLINSEIHNINIRHISNLLLPLGNSGIYQKGVYYSDIKIFNSLPFNIKKFSNNLRTFKSALKHFLYMNSFYSLD
jgi:hypothetical protein